MESSGRPDRPIRSLPLAAGQWQQSPGFESGDVIPLDGDGDDVEMCLSCGADTAYRLCSLLHDRVDVRRSLRMMYNGRSLAVSIGLAVLAWGRGDEM